MVKKCKFCQSDFESNVRGIYCSAVCGKNQRKYGSHEEYIKQAFEERTCINCNVVFLALKLKVKSFCSQKCRKEYRQIQITRPLIREYFLEKFNFTCQKCNVQQVNNCDFHLHHKIFLYKGGTDEEQNITLLCHKCHKIEHKIL